MLKIYSYHMSKLINAQSNYNSDKHKTYSQSWHMTAKVWIWPLTYQPSCCKILKITRVVQPSRYPKNMEPDFRMALTFELPTCFKCDIKQTFLQWLNVWPVTARQPTLLLLGQFNPFLLVWPSTMNYHSCTQDLEPNLMPGQAKFGWLDARTDADAPKCICDNFIEVTASGHDIKLWLKRLENITKI